MAASDRVTFTCDGAALDVAFEPGASLLDILREQLGIRGVKDGCAPQGQCGCCTVLVDGQPRVACVTPPTRVAGRAVTTVNGLADDVRDRLLAAFVADGRVAMRVLHTGDRRACGLAARSQQWRCDAGRDRPHARGAPMPVHRLAHREGGDRRRGAGRCVRLPTRSRRRRTSLDAGRRCGAARPIGCPARRRWVRRRSRAARRSRRSPAFAAAPPDATSFEAEGIRWAVGSTLVKARTRAGKIQGRRTTQTSGPPLDAPGATAARCAARYAVGRAHVPRAGHDVVRPRR